MGGVPVLLKLIAMMGITYGWQPDNYGGVEYIVQVSPDDLQDIERLGEISSAIDPKVQGHVSRVIIRVGRGPLPRKTPPNLAQRSRNAADIAADYSAVPIPEMQDSRRAIPIAGVASQRGQRQAEVMKPQTGGGFNLPNLPSSLAGGQDASKSLNQAGQELLQRGAEKFGNAASEATKAFQDAAAKSLRGQASRQAAPPFTGSDPNGTFARPRTNGPSTDPSGARNTTWNDFARTRPGGPSTNPVSNSNAARPDPRAATGLGPSDAFGQMPRGTSFSRNDTTNPFTDPSRTQPQAEMFSQAQQIALDRQRQQARLDEEQRVRNATLAQTPVTGTDQDLTAAEIAAGAVKLDSYRRPIDKYGRLVTVSPTRSPATTSQFDPYAEQRARLNGQSASSLGPPNPNLNAPTNKPLPGRTTPSLTAAEIEAQRMAQLQDQQRQQDLIRQQQEQALRSQQGQSFNTPFTNNINQPSFNQLSPERFATNQRQFEPQREQGLQAPSINQPIRNGNLAQTQSNPTVFTNAPSRVLERDPPSLSNRPPQLESAISTRRVAAQPLFNGLLLVSFVANIYLMFWLKNLRLQFRDMVAAKRLANSTTNQVA
ncbi:MAG: hypothetical protein AB8B91_08815 [Rubripirellula sp.]